RSVPWSGSSPIVDVGFGNACAAELALHVPRHAGVLFENWNEGLHEALHILVGDGGHAGAEILDGVVVALDHGGGVHGVDAVGVGGFKLAQHALRLQAGDLEIEGALGSTAFGRRGVVTG